MALEITPGRDVHIAGKEAGYAVLCAQSIVLATGCRERARGAVGIPGTRPAGIITAGTAQRYVNMEGYMPGSRIVIVGSGDVGLIMARRLTLEGAKVLACVEILPHSGGLMRNIVQCLYDFDIPLLLSHTVTDIRGNKRVEGVTVSEVDENRRIKSGSDKLFKCDTVLLSVGLIPENELANAAGIKIGGHNIHTSAPGVFVCGNALQVHDIVDNVTLEANKAGIAAAAYVLSGGLEKWPS
jgi:NADPH-dependent 2,4-dienoyl-CoA reductase/sulfur reductase-like enzyme